jgi:hypothetical protein
MDCCDTTAKTFNQTSHFVDTLHCERMLFFFLCKDVVLHIMSYYINDFRKAALLSVSSIVFIRLFLVFHFL